MALLRAFKRVNRGVRPFSKGFQRFKGVKGIVVLKVFDVLFDVFNGFSLGMVELYTVFIVFSLPETPVKIVAKTLAKQVKGLNKQV